MTVNNLNRYNYVYQSFNYNYVPDLFNTWHPYKLFMYEVSNEVQSVSR